MWRFLYLLLPCCLIFSEIRAQIERPFNQVTPEVRYGLKLDLNRAGLSENGGNEHQMHWGVGLSVRFPIRRNLLVQPELSYSQRGSSPVAWEGRGIASDFRYLDGVLLITYVPIDFIHVNAGAGTGLFIDADFTENGRPATTGVVPGNFSRYDPFVCGGMELVFEPLAFGARLNYGLLPFASEGGAEQVYGQARHLWFQASVALLF